MYSVGVNAVGGFYKEFGNFEYKTKKSAIKMMNTLREDFKRNKVKKVITLHKGDSIEPFAVHDMFIELGNYGPTSREYLTNNKLVEENA